MNLHRGEGVLTLLLFVHQFSKRTSISLSDRWRDAMCPSVTYKANSGTERPAADRADMCSVCSSWLSRSGLALFTFSFSLSNASFLRKLAAFKY